METTLARKGLALGVVAVLHLLTGCAGPGRSGEMALVRVEQGNEVRVENSPVRVGWFRRSESERAGDSEAERFGTFRVLGVVIVQHPRPEAAERINRDLLAAVETEYDAGAVSRPDGTPLPVFSDERSADAEARLAVLPGGPEIFSVLVEKSYRPAGSMNSTETTEIRHYDLKTGEPVRWGDLVRPTDWPTVRGAALALFAEDVDVLLKAEFSELPEWPDGYVADGALWLLVRSVAGSSAGESGRFYPVPVALVRGLLKPELLARFGSVAAAVPPQGWAVQRTARADGTKEIEVVFSGDKRGETASDTLRVTPQLDGGEPELLEWTSNVELKLGLLHYFAGWVGTLDKYAVTRVAVIDLDTGKLLGCPPRSYTPMNGAPPVTQPVYRVEAGRLVVEDVEWGGRERFGGQGSP